MLIKFPMVCLYYHNRNRNYEDWVRDVSNGKYGYILKPGAEVFRINYWHDSPGRCSQGYHCKIEEITDEGLLISKWMEHGWETDNFAILGLVREDGKAFLPWKWKDDWEICIEPCRSLFENYSMKKLLEGKAEESHPTKTSYGRIIPDPTGSGIWYEHGGWRRKTVPYMENLSNFVRADQYQTSIFDYLEE